MNTQLESCEGPWKLVPMKERSYDMRAKAIIAFNTAAGDLDDKLQAAWAASVEAAPAPPVSAPAAQPAQAVSSTAELQQLLKLANERDPARWEIGFRNIVAILLGPRTDFDIADVVEAVRALAASQATEQPQDSKTVEALEYLFLSIATRADSDYRFRAMRRAEEALMAAMPGWTSPVPATEQPRAEPDAALLDVDPQYEAKLLRRISGYRASTRGGSVSVPSDPTPEMLKAFQDGFIRELHKPQKRRTMTAEIAGLRAMLAVLPQHPEPTPAAAQSVAVNKALKAALFAMEMNQWNWKSMASNDMKREAVSLVRAALSDAQKEGQA